MAEPKQVSIQEGYEFLKAQHKQLVEETNRSSVALQIIENQAQTIARLEAELKQLRPSNEELAEKVGLKVVE